MAKTFHETKISMADTDGYFYIKNESYKIYTAYFGSISGSYTTHIQYSYDKVNWSNLTLNDTVNFNAGEKVYFRSTDGWFDTSGGGLRLNSSTLRFIFSIGGNLATLIDYTNKDNVTTIPEKCFKNLFQSNSNLISIDKLSFGNITTIGLNSCDSMFSGTNGLTGVMPDFSKITTVGDYGMYNMFSQSSAGGKCDLSSLTSVGATGLQTMFSQNTAIQSADLGSLTTIGSFGCSAMFQYCRTLGEVKAPNVSIWETNKMTNWLAYTVSSSGPSTRIVYCPTGVTIPTDNNSGIPIGWTRVDY